MDKRVLRSVLAILLGWATPFAGWIVATIVIAIVHRGAFKPGEQLSAEWLLVTLVISSVLSVVGGFVTGAIAQRREIWHAIGLALLMLSFLLYFTIRDWSTTQTPHWYTVVALVSVIPTIFLGGWLRMKQRILLDKKSPGMIRAVNSTRLAAAVVVSLALFFILISWGTLFVVGGLMWVLRIFFGNDYDAPVVTPVFLASIILASVLSRRAFRRIVGGDPALLKDRRQD